MMKLATCIQHVRILRTAPASGADLLRCIGETAVRDPRLMGFAVDQLTDGLVAREAIGSTGFGGGIAIPHCHIAELEDFVGGLIVIPDGVPFDAADDRPVCLAAFVIAPESRRDEHVALLAAISRVLNAPNAVSEILAAPTEEGALEAFFRYHVTSAPVVSRNEKCLLTVCVQREDVLVNILQVLVAQLGGNLSILEGRSARAYLHRVPLYAGMWTDAPDRPIQVITSVVDRPLCNEIARRVLLAAQPSSGPDARGVLVVAQDILFVSGGLEF